MRAVIRDLIGFFTSPPFSFTWVGGADGMLMRRNFGDNLTSTITRYYPTESVSYTALRPYVAMKNHILAKEGKGYELLYFDYPCLDFQLRDHIDFIGDYSVFENQFMPLICKRDLSEFIVDTDYGHRAIAEFTTAIENIKLLDYFSKTTGNEVERTLKMFDFYTDNIETMPQKPKYILSGTTGNRLIQDTLDGKYRFSSLVDVDAGELKSIITQLKFKYQKDFKPSFKDYAHLI